VTLSVEPWAELAPGDLAAVQDEGVALLAFLAPDRPFEIQFTAVD
jgi:hypothetical protein